MLLRHSGRVISVNLEQPRKAEDPMSVMFSDIFILSRPEQSSKALEPIVLTESDIITSFIVLRFSNALAGIAVTLSPILIVVRLSIPMYEVL